MGTTFLDIVSGIDKEDLALNGYDDTGATFGYGPTGDIWLVGDELISRSAKPELLKELCKEYDITANTFEEFMDKTAGDINDDYGFYIDIKDKVFETSFFMRISTLNEVIELEIPLSKEEQDYAFKICAECFKDWEQENIYSLIEDNKPNKEKEAVISQE